MDWDKLNSPVRLRKQALERDPYDLRSDFEGDYDRVIFSSSFRRLQDKTQAFPLDPHDFVRTRLTHSCEVSAVGSALGSSVVRQLEKEGKSRNINHRDFGSLIATSCLLHDLGNPPFGHSGEDAISSAFKRILSEKRLELADEQEALDLTAFEGNAHAFRVATRLQTLGKDFGLNLTAGTLACLLKYPCSSTEGRKKEKDAPKALSKYGYFKADAHAFRRVRDAVGLNGTARHPLTLLMEAADDICYSVVDIEDALKKKLLTKELVADWLKERIPAPQFKQLVEDNFLKRAEGLLSTTRDRVQLAFQHFRAVAIGKMTASAVAEFTRNFKEVEAGEYHGEIATNMEFGDFCNALKNLAKEHVYTHQDIAIVEEAGRHIICGLLHIFVDELKHRPTGKIARSLVPPTPTQEGDDTVKTSDDYKAAQRAADYVAGMTDTFAVDLYRRLTGTVR